MIPLGLQIFYSVALIRKEVLLRLFLATTGQHCYLHPQPPTSRRTHECGEHCTMSHLGKRFHTLVGGTQEENGEHDAEIQLHLIVNTPAF